MHMKPRQYTADSKLTITIEHQENQTDPLFKARKQHKFRDGNSSQEIRQRISYKCS